jgi:hypothetical protein
MWRSCSESLKIHVLWDVIGSCHGIMPCHWVSGSQGFDGWRRYDPSKQLEPLTHRHSVASHKTQIFNMLLLCKVLKLQEKYCIKCISDNGQCAIYLCYNHVISVTNVKKICTQKGMVMWYPFVTQCTRCAPRIFHWVELTLRLHIIYVRF